MVSEHSQIKVITVCAVAALSPSNDFFVPLIYTSEHAWRLHLLGAYLLVFLNRLMKNTIFPKPEPNCFGCQIQPTSPACRTCATKKHYLWMESMQRLWLLTKCISCCGCLSVYRCAVAVTRLVLPLDCGLDYDILSGGLEIFFLLKMNETLQILHIARRNKHSAKHETVK